MTDVTAYETKALTCDRRARIKDRNLTNYTGAVNELRSGRWLRDVGLPLVCWEPPAADSRTGDIQVSSSNGPVFVEVKTVFGDRGSVTAERVSGDLTRGLDAQVHLPNNVRCVVDVSIGGESAAPFNCAEVISMATRLVQSAASTGKAAKEVSNVHTRGV